MSSHTPAGGKGHSLVQTAGQKPFAHIVMLRFAWEGWGQAEVELRLFLQPLLQQPLLQGHM